MEKSVGLPLCTTHLLRSARKAMDKQLMWRSSSSCGWLLGTNQNFWWGTSSSTETGISSIGSDSQPLRTCFRVVLTAQEPNVIRRRSACIAFAPRA